MKEVMKAGEELTARQEQMRAVPTGLCPGVVGIWRQEWFILTGDAWIGWIHSFKKRIVRCLL